METQRASYRVPRAHGPRVAVIGGGHGLSTMLRGLKQYTENITAIVTEKGICRPPFTQSLAALFDNKT